MKIQNLVFISDLFRTNQGIVDCSANMMIARGDYTSFNIACQSIGMQTNEFGGQLELKIKSFIGAELICFREIQTYFYSYSTKEDFAILDVNGDYCYYNAKDKQLTFGNNVEEKFITVCRNAFSYYQFYNFLKSENFADHHNDANTEIIIYNSAKGIFKIKYDSSPTIIDNKDISKAILSMIQIASSIEICPFFKNALFAISNDIGSISISNIILQHAEIIAITKRDFELVSKKFDFENFKDSLYKQKEKYFADIREIINKIFGQAVGIPISIGATVFSTYKVLDNLFMLFIVMTSFIVYVVFYVRLQMIYRSDILELKNDFENDFLVIKASSGLPANLIEDEVTKITKKIKNSISIINGLIGTVMILGILVCWYIFYEMIESSVVLLVIGLLKIFK